MPFIETKAKSEFKIIDGKKTHVITPECEITLTNTQSGKEYMSDEEADHDVDNPILLYFTTPLFEFLV